MVLSIMYLYLKAGNLIQKKMKEADLCKEHMIVTIEKCKKQCLECEIRQANEIDNLDDDDRYDFHGEESESLDSTMTDDDAW